MASRNAVFVSTLFFFVTGITSTWAQQYVFRSIDVPGAGDTYVGANNNSGAIVGCYPLAGLISDDLGYLLSKGVFKAVKYPGAPSTCPNGVSGNGIVGAYQDGGGKFHGFLLAGKTYSSFDYPGALLTSGLDVNNSGVIVGYYYDGAGYHGFKLQSGTFTLLDPPGAAGSIADTINNSGQIVGYYSLTDPMLNHDSQGYLLSGSSYTPINYPGATGTAAIGLNKSGQIVGFYSDSGGVFHGFTDFGGVFSTLDYPGANNSYAVEINDSGQIVGDWTSVSSSYDQHGFLASPIPGTYGPAPGNAPFGQKMISQH